MADIKEVKLAVSNDKKARSQSAIAYPYFNLNSSIEVARAIQERGGGECSSEQLASFLNYSTTRSGTFVTRISAARLFGLITGKLDSLGVTDRALAIISPVMPEDDARARAEAFLEVPLFRDIYDRFKGKSLPPEVGLKNLFENSYKIPKDRLAPAARVFYEAAEQAGFFDLSPEKTQLIAPLMKKKADKPQGAGEKPGEVDPEKLPPERPRGGGGGDGPTGIHPALSGLLRELPAPGPWDAEKKKQFLEAFGSIFNFIYPSKDSE